jgi:hypothetical protein
VNAPAIRLSLPSAGRPPWRLIRSKGSASKAGTHRGAGEAGTSVAKGSGKPEGGKGSPPTLKSLHRDTLLKCRAELLPVIAKHGFDSEAEAIGALDSWVEQVHKFFVAKQNDKGLPASALSMIVRDLSRHKTGELWHIGKRVKRDRLWSNRQIAMLAVLGGYAIPLGGRLADANPGKTIRAVESAVNMVLRRVQAERELQQKKLPPDARRIFQQTARKKRKRAT